MTKVILDIPTEKMHSFIKLVLKLGIDKHTISSGKRHSGSKKNTISALETQFQGNGKRFPSFLLFDWEFFSNELEYE